MAGQPVFGPSAEDGVDYLEVSSQYLNRQDSLKIKVKAKRVWTVEIEAILPK